MLMFYQDREGRRFELLVNGFEQVVVVLVRAGGNRFSATIDELLEKDRRDALNEVWGPPTKRMRELLRC